MKKTFIAPIYQDRGNFYTFMPTTKVRHTPSCSYELPVWGKRCFPDRNKPQNLSVGIAEVTITKELDNVAFFTARMLPVKQPSNELLAEYLLNKPMMDGLHETALAGMRLDFDVQDAVVAFWPDGIRYFALYEHEDRIIPILHESRHYTDKDFVRAYDFLSKEVLVATGAELLKDFEDFKYFCFRSKKASDIYINDVFDDAIASELVGVYEVYGVKFVEFYNFATVSLLFSRDEMDDIIAHAIAINKAAHETIEKKIGKGLIPVHRMPTGQVSIDPRR